ncbi:MAG: tetratricopeptide repeat protein [Stigonema ocellatum SAG 48.90 = DSM 106950]|nr:tetratricopeptide repeat protein [Stigonema ocellatum SAG 48.90 = DSM 106950]
MSQPRNRWIVKVVLVLALFAFLGVSIVPIIGALNKPAPEQKSKLEDGVAGKSKLEDEIRGLELVLQREPENQAALKSLLEARLQLFRQEKGDMKKIIEPLEKLAKLNPENTQYTVLLAQAKLGIGDTEGAAAAYRSILQTKPGDIKALQGMVILLLKQKRPEAAIGLLQDTLSNAPKVNKIQPGSVDTIAVQVLLGNIYAFQKRYDQALAVNDQAIKNDPQDFRPVLAKAMLLKQQGKMNQAKPLFDKAVSLAPPNYKDEINKHASSSPTPTPTPTPTPGS